MSWEMHLNKCGRREGTGALVNVPLSDQLGDRVCRYNELMFIIDTCQAASMFTTFYSPNIVATGSSSVNEDSLSVSRPFSWLS